MLEIRGKIEGGGKKQLQSGNPSPTDEFRPVTGHIHEVDLVFKLLSFHYRNPQCGARC